MRRCIHPALAGEPRQKGLDGSTIQLCRVRRAVEANKRSYLMDIGLFCP